MAINVIDTRCPHAYTPSVFRGIPDPQTIDDPRQGFYECIYCGHRISLAEVAARFRLRAEREKGKSR